MNESQNSVLCDTNFPGREYNKLMYTTKLVGEKGSPRKIKTAEITSRRNKNNRTRD